MSREDHSRVAGGGTGPTDQKTQPSLALLCRLASGLCALPLDCVIETMRPLPVARVDHAPPFVLGLAVVRGEAIPVIDGARLLGAGPASLARRFVTLKVGSRRVALAVDDVVGLRDLAALSLGALPPLLAQVETDAVAAIGSLDQQLLLVLGGARAVPASAWAALETVRVAP
ncbi:MAG TPA: chemotaxis protein CheW [Polyangia bacterium]